jgi:hypothetical protein
VTAQDGFNALKLAIQIRENILERLVNANTNHHIGS